MAVYTMTPEERRARAQAIMGRRDMVVQYKKAQEARQAYESERRRQLEKERAEKEGVENMNWFVRGLSTIGDVVANVLEGAVKGLEGIYDLGAGIVGAVGGIFSDDFRDSVQDHIAYDFAGEIVGAPLQEALRYSYLKEDGIIEGVASGIGQMLPAVIATIATYGAYAGVGAATTAASAAGTAASAASAAAQAAQVASLVTMGVSAAGTATEEAFQEGANYYAGLGYGVASGLVEVGTEKLFGGATKALTGAGIFDGVVESTAKTGIRRIALNAVEEGAEEVVAELANPALKSIYKGSDAFSQYGDWDYWKGVGKTAIVGSLTALGYSGTVGYGMSKIKTKSGQRLNYVGKEADVQEVLGSLENLKAREKNLQESGTGLTEKKVKIAETTRKGYQQIETILKGATEKKRASLIKEFSLDRAFNPDGSLSAEMATRLGIGQVAEQSVNGETTPLASDVNDYNYSTSLWGREREIESDFSVAIDDLAKSYIEDMKAKGETVTLEEAREKVGKLSIKKEGLEGVAMERRNKFNKALNALDRLSGTETSFVVVDSSELGEGQSFKAFRKGDKIYIDSHDFESGAWAEDLVHEYTHLEEGSQEYEEMVEFLQSDDLVVDDNGTKVKLWEKAQSEVFSKKYGLSPAEIETISEKVKAGEKLTEKESAMYHKFRNELVAHETGILLGNESFVDRIISKDSSLVKRIIDKIVNLKKAFEKADKSSAQYKQLLEAEKLYLNAARRVGDIKLARYIINRDRSLTEEVDTVDEAEYNKRGIVIEDKQEYAVLAQELARKNGDKPRRVEYAYTSNNFYIVTNNRQGNFTPILQLDIEANQELIDTIRSEIDNGTYKQAKTIAEWIRLVQSGEGGYGSHLDGSTRGRANGRVDEVYDGESEGNARGNSRSDGGNQGQVDGVHIVSDSDGTVQFNLNTYNEGGREVLEKNLLAKGFNDSDVESALTTMDELASFMEELGTTYKDLADWNNAKVYYDNEGHAIYSAMVTNGDYPLNIDLSTICRKRKALTRVLNELVKRNLIDDVSLSQENIVKINEILKKNGFEVACPACFVETKRYRLESWAADFVSVWNKVIRSLNIASPESLDFTNGKTTVSNGESIDVTELGKRIEAKEFGGRENQLIAKLIHDHPELRGFLKKSDLIGTVGLDSIKKNAPELYQRVLNKKGSATPKPMQEFTPYNHELADISDLATRAKDVGGVRMFSFSDFTIDQVFDYMQVIADLHSKKATMHTYTKVISFARIFGKTGIKINMSMIPNIDKSVSRENAGLDSEGNLLWSEFGVDYGEAVALMTQEGYSQNVGTTTIGVSDNHIRKLLANEYTNYVIPYHRSGINKLVAKMSDIDYYKDYTLQQRTRYRKNGVGSEIKYAEGRSTIHPKDGRGKAVSKTEEFNFFESLQRLGDAKAMAHEYLEWCDEKGYIPKFEQFTADENYYKLLVDFRVYDAITGEAVPQVPATLAFPDNVTEIIESELATQEIAKGKEGAVFEGALAEIYEVIRKGGKQTESETATFVNGDESVQWSLRTKEPPKKTIKAYKVFFAKNGGLYPPMVANPNGEPTPIGVWLDADIGASAGVSKTGRPQVKAGGKGTQGGSGSLAFRPGWHLGEYPKATQFNRLNPKTGKKELFPKDFVWAECEIAADIDYQEEAMSYGYTEGGKFRHSYAGLPKLPTDGYYQYRTNPDPSTVPWYITGAMKVTRILDDNDVREILKGFGVEPIEREGGDIDLSKYGLTRGDTESETQFNLSLPEDPTATNSNGETLTGEQVKYFADSLVRDSEGRLLLVYHGSPNRFTEFSHSYMSTNGSAEGQGFYFTNKKTMAEGYKRDGGQLLSGYLLIKKPLSDSEKTLTRAEVKKLIETLDPTGDDVVINYDSKGGLGYPSRSWYARALEDTVNAVMRYSDTDSEILAEIANSGAGTKAVVSTIRRLFGYDGYIVEGKYEGATVYVAFESNQFKLSDNAKPTENQDIQFSLTLPEDPTAKPYFYELTDGQVKKLLANYTRRKVYNKVEAEEIITTVVGSYLSFGDTYGTISGKSKAEVIDMLWRGLNTAVPGKQAKIALDVAEYIIQHSIVESIYDDPSYETYTDTIALLKPYLHAINLDGIKSEIKSRYNKDNSPYLLWGKRKGDSGLGADVIAMELDDLGFHIDAINEADIFFQIDEAYRTAVAGLKKDAKAILSESLNTEERKQLKQDLAKEILRSFDTHGKPSKLSEFLGEYAKKAQFWREKYYEEKKKNKVLNRVLDKIQRIKDIKLGTFINASQYKTDIFKGSIEQLSRIKYRGNLNESGTRDIIKGLSEWYNEENPMLAGQFDEDIAVALKEFANGEGKLTTDDLKALENIIDYFKHFIETYNKVYRNGQYVEAEPIAKKYVEIIHTNEKAKVGWLRKFFEKYLTTFGDPMTVVRYMDRYSDGFYTEMLESLRKGAIGAGVMEMEMREPIEAFYKKNKKFLKSLKNKTVTYQGSEIPLSQAMLLYMSLNRDQAILGLAKSGFAYTAEDGKVIRINGFAVEEDLEIEEIRVRAKEVQKGLASQFTEAEKEYIAIAERLFNEDCKEAKKKTDMQLRGYTNALEDYYVPIRRYVVGQSVDTESYLDEMARVSNASFNKDTVKGARNELYLGTLESVLDRHIRAVSLYANLAMPLREYDVLYNLDTAGNPNKPTSVKTEGVNAWAEGQEYFQKLVKDIQGIPASKSVINKWLSKLRGGYAKYQLGANPKVWVTQLSSFAAAGNILDIGSIVRGLGIKASDVDEYCSLAKLRNNENTAALSQGVMEKTGKIGDVLMKPIGMVDRLVIKKLFGACQVQVEKDGGAKIGTKENKTKAGELLERVILETQQNAIATERSSAMRDGSEIMKTLTMFSADSMKVLGRVVDSIGEVAVLKTKRKNATDPKEIASLDKKIKTATKKAGRSIASLVSTAVFMALIAQAFRTLYNKDDEDENIVQNMTVDAIGNLFGGLPLIRDIYSFYAEGYDLDNYAYSTVNDLLKSGQDIFDLIGSIFDGSTDSRDVATSIKKAAYAGGQLLGIPTRNIYNFVYGLTKRFSPSTAYKIDDVFYKQSYRADLAKAIENDDEAMIATIAELMLDENLGGLSDSKARKEMASLLEKGFDVIPRSVGDTITYDGEEHTLTTAEKKAFEKVYSTANEAVASLVKLSQYDKATDEVKAKAVNFIYTVYYNLALQDFLGVDLENKNILFAEAIDIEKLALIVATARTIVGDTDKSGKVVSGSRKRKVQAYINSLNLKAVQKYMVMGYLGYSNQYGENQVKAYINRLSLTKAEKEKLLAYSGYAS